MQMKKNAAPVPAGTLAPGTGQACVVLPRIPSGLVGADQLETLARVMRAYKIPLAKLTSGQRIALVGVAEAQVAAVRAELGLGGVAAGGFPSCYVQACPGSTACANGQQDSLTMGARLEALVAGLELPAKLKAGVSGCPRCCGESYVRDIGLVGRKGGWTLIFGGNAGGRPRVGDELASGLDADAALELLGRALAHYAANARKLQRTARFVEAQGIDSLRAALGLELGPGT